MVTVVLAEADRPAYHAAASIASNFLITLEGGRAPRRHRRADRALLVPLVRATVENWAALGAHAALTGPVARGDEGTSRASAARSRERTPELLDAFDALVTATRALAGAAIPSGRAA